MPFGNGTVLSESLKAYEGIETRVLVASEAMTFEGWRTVVNQDPARGLSSSLKLGLAALPECDGVLIGLGDMPLIQRETVAALVAGFDTKQAIAPSSTGHPLLVPKALLGLAEQATGDSGLRKLLPSCRSLEINDPGTRLDADRPHAYGRLLRMRTGSLDK